MNNYIIYHEPSNSIILSHEKLVKDLLTCFSEGSFPTDGGLWPGHP